MARFPLSSTLRVAGMHLLLPALGLLGGGASLAQTGFGLPGAIVIKLPPPKPDELIAISAGANHTCVTRRDGIVLCWGRNAEGQLGIGTLRSDWCYSFYCAVVPTRVTTDIQGAAFSATRVSAGWDHTCSLDGAGAASCWGLNANGQTGVAVQGTVWQPTATASGRRFTALSAGNQTTCGVEPGATFCWGLLNDGRPGSFTLNGDMRTGVVVRTLTPTAILPSSANFQAVSVGNMHACMQTSLAGFNEVNCIGRNDFGELGYDPSIGPAFVIFGSTFGRPVGPPSSRGTFTCVDRLGDGTVACAGQNTFGMLGNGGNADTGAPQLVGGGTRLAGVAAGWTHACAIDPQQQAFCWGANGSGQLGNGTRSNSNRPVLVGGGSVKFRALAAGNEHTCGIGTDNNVYCWGGNGAGQLGRGYYGSYDWTPRVASGPFRL